MFTTCLVAETTWSHIAFVYTRSAGTVQVYVNGVSIGVSGSIGTGTAPNGGALVFGQRALLRCCRIVLVFRTNNGIVAHAQANRF